MVADALLHCAREQFVASGCFEAMEKLLEHHNSTVAQEVQRLLKTPSETETEFVFS